MNEYVERALLPSLEPCPEHHGTQDGWKMICDRKLMVMADGEPVFTHVLRVRRVDRFDGQD